MNLVFQRAVLGAAAFLGAGFARGFLYRGFGGSGLFGAAFAMAKWFNPMMFYICQGFGSESQAFHGLPVLLYSDGLHPPAIR